MNMNNMNMNNMNNNNMNMNYMNNINMNYMNMNNMNNKNMNYMNNNNMNMNNMNNMNNNNMSNNMNNMNNNNINSINRNNINMNNMNNNIIINMSNMNNNNMNNNNMNMNNNNINMNNINNNNMNMNNMNNNNNNYMNNNNMNMNNMNNINKSNMNNNNINMNNMNNNNMNMNNMNNNNNNYMNNNNMNMNNNNINMNNMFTMNINNNVINNPPMKIIKNFSSNFESSYANAVLQAFSSLDCIHNWIKELNKSNLMQNIQASITKEFYMLFYNLYCGNQVDSTNLISTLENQVRAIYHKDMKKDDYHILYYLLDMLHLENNCPINSNFDINSYKNQNMQNMKNDNYMYNSFRNFYQQTTNSVISQYFYNIEKYFTLCFNCDKIFYYDHKTIITFDLDKFISLRNQTNQYKIGTNINLAECFYFYQNEKSCQCPICRNSMSLEKTSMLFSTKVLILRFKRLFHNLKCDVDFDIQFNINNMINSNTNSETLKNNYYLKSIIYLKNSNNCFKYFSDACINDKWYRFCDDNNYVMNISNYNELKMYEPQMLIYELNEDNNKFNPFYNSLNNKNNIITMMQLINMQIQMLQLKELMKRVSNNAEFNTVNMNVRNNNNFNFNNFNNQNNNNNNQNLNLDFVIIPENWNGNKEDCIKIKPQVTFEDTMEKAINNFYTKLLKPREAIKRFEFNNQMIDPNSKLKLRDFCINNDSIIYAIKADNFDILSIFNNNNNNQNNFQNQNVNNNNQNSIFLSLDFVIVPEGWNGDEKDSFKIKPQVTLEDTVEKAINNFYIKLVKPREAIKRFEFNHLIVNVNSKTKLRDFGVQNNSIIYAIKADNFDALSLNNNNNNFNNLINNNFNNNNFNNNNFNNNNFNNNNFNNNNINNNYINNN